MAETLESYEFKHGPLSPYPWATWLDGKIYRLSRGADFTCTLGSLRVRLYAEAAKAGVCVQTRFEPYETIVIRAYRQEEEVKSRAGK